MADSTRMIVLCKDILGEGEEAKTVDIESFATEIIKRPKVRQAQELAMLSESELEEEEKEGLVTISKEGRFFVADLTDKEVKDLKKSDEVEEIVEDEEVFALTEPGMSSVMEEGDLGALDIDGLLELDGADTILSEPPIFPGWDGEQDDFVSEQELALSTQLEPSVNDSLELGLESDMPQSCDDGSQLINIPGLPKEKILCIIKSVIQCLIGSGKSVADVNQEQVEAILRTLGTDTDDSRTLADVILWNLRLIFANNAWRYSTGAGVRVAVVDTGIDSSHPDLRVYGGVSYVPGVSSYRDDNGHGTHVAGTIAALANGRGIIGVAPHARLYAVKVLNRSGSGRLSWILNGLAWCYRQRMHVVNLSLGSLASTHNLNTFNRAYERMGQWPRRRGILAVAAAGNSGASRSPYVGNPARCPSYLSVAAIDSRRRRASFSSYGPQVEISGPGVSVYSTVPGGGYRSLSGTSMACPHVAAVAALVKRRRPSWHGDRIRVHLWRTALDLGARGRDWLYGYGQVNAYQAVVRG